MSTGYLRLVTDGDTVPLAEGPEQHLRNAIQAAILAEARLAELLIPVPPDLADLMRTIEARLFRALLELGQDVRDEPA